MKDVNISMSWTRDKRGRTRDFPYVPPSWQADYHIIHIHLPSFKSPSFSIPYSSNRGTDPRKSQNLKGSNSLRNVYPRFQSSTNKQPIKSGYEISRVKDAKQVARKAENSSFRQAWSYDKCERMVTFAWLLLPQHQRQRFLSVGLPLFHLCDWQENKQKYAMRNASK